jgi:hypothetical protein
MRSEMRIFEWVLGDNQRTFDKEDLRLHTRPDVPQKDTERRGDQSIY